MSDSPIRLGIIGLGPANMASTMTMLQDEPDLRYTITAACARRPDVLEQAARQFNIPYWSTDYRDIVARDDVDVVCVYSPDALHAESCIGALENNKHVMCTKPMVTTLEDARRLVDLVRDTGAKFLVGQTMRFDRQFLAAKKIYDDGQLGSLIALESFYLHDMRPIYDFTPWRLTMPQDFMFGGCVHSIDIIRAFGGDIKRVHAIANKGGLTPDYPIPDNFFINAEFTSGVIGRVSGLYGIVHPPLPMMQYGVYGTKGQPPGRVHRQRARRNPRRPRRKHRSRSRPPPTTPKPISAPTDTAPPSSVTCATSRTASTTTRTPPPASSTAPNR